VTLTVQTTLWSLRMCSRAITNGFETGASQALSRAC
jgi:hypothetical protein